MYAMDNVYIPILASEQWVIFVFKISMQCTYANCSCHTMCS